MSQPTAGAILDAVHEHVKWCNEHALRGCAKHLTDLVNAAIRARNPERADDAVTIAIRNELAWVTAAKDQAVLRAFFSTAAVLRGQEIELEREIASRSLTAGRGPSAEPKRNGYDLSKQDHDITGRKIR